MAQNSKDAQKRTSRAERRAAEAAAMKARAEQMEKERKISGINSLCLFLRQFHHSGIDLLLKLFFLQNHLRKNGNKKRQISVRENWRAR